MACIRSRNLTNDVLTNSFPKILELLHENTLGRVLKQNSSQVFPGSDLYDSIL